MLVNYTNYTNLVWLYFYFILFAMEHQQHRRLSINNQLLMQQLPELYIDAQGVINLVGRTWPRYLTTVGYVNTMDQLKHLIPVYCKHFSTLRKKLRIRYGFTQNWFLPLCILKLHIWEE